MSDDAAAAAPAGSTHLLGLCWGSSRGRSLPPDTHHHHHVDGSDLSLGRPSPPPPTKDANLCQPRGQEQGRSKLASAGANNFLGESNGSSCSNSSSLLYVSAAATVDIQSHQHLHDVIPAGHHGQIRRLSSTGSLRSGIIDRDPPHFHQLEQYLQALEHERHKITTSFPVHQLPICIHLLNEAIRALKHKLAGQILYDGLHAAASHNYKHSFPMQASSTDKGLYRQFEAQPLIHGACRDNDQGCNDSQEGVKQHVRTTKSASSDTNISHQPVQQQLPAPRKARRCWSPELHQCFLHALHQLGGPKLATPKQIRELMNVEGLTNDEVKSHLQKFRLYTARNVTNSLAHQVLPLHRQVLRPHLLLFGGVAPSTSKTSNPQQGQPRIAPSSFEDITLQQLNHNYLPCKTNYSRLLHRQTLMPDQKLIHSQDFSTIIKEQNASIDEVINNHDEMIHQQQHSKGQRDLECVPFLWRTSHVKENDFH